jgi:hypothetical protein
MYKLALSALLIPAIAFAQSVDDPASAPPTSPPPVVIVNPPAPAPTRTVITMPQYETVYDTYNAPVFTTGALVFIGSYGSSVVAAAGASGEERDRGADKLYIPLAGPWLALNARGSCPPTSSSCDMEATKKVLLVVDGIFQAAGVITMIDGVLQPTSHRVVTQTTKVERKVRVAPAVVSAQGTPGVQVFGRF